MSVLNPFPLEKLVDAQGRPYFLWDVEMSLDEFRNELNGDNPIRRAYLLGKLLRQARPDDVFTFVTVARLRTDWDQYQRYLGNKRRFWRWVLDQWEALGVA